MLWWRNLLSRQPEGNHRKCLGQVIFIIVGPLDVAEAYDIRVLGVLEDAETEIKEGKTPSNHPQLIGLIRPG